MTLKLIMPHIKLQSHDNNDPEERLSVTSV